jgi:TRAP-type mannitol/chloroaromatic compound transport system substrate-binding protein
LKGLKYRTVGLSIEIFTDMGASVQALPGGEIIPAMDRGVLDAAEFNNASSDRILGFPDVSKINMLQSFHQSSEQFEIIFNKKKFNSLPADLQAILTYGTQAASADMSWKAIDRYSKDFAELQTKDKVKFYATPKSILVAQLNAWDKIIAKKASELPMFKKVLDSQKAFAQRAVRWDLLTNVDMKIAYDHYFKG